LVIEVRPLRQDGVARHRMALDREAEAFEQLGRALRMRRVVPRRRVRRHADQRLQNATCSSKWASIQESRRA
jgi:hypothetical protein